MPDGRSGYGQVAARYGSSGGHFYFVVIHGAHSLDHEASVQPAHDQIALLALSMDALLFHGHWAIVGHTSVPEDRIRWPEYKIATAPGVYDVDDAMRTTTRPATQADVDALPTAQWSHR